DRLGHVHPAEAERPSPDAPEDGVTKNRPAGRDGERATHLGGSGDEPLLEHLRRAATTGRVRLVDWLRDPEPHRLRPRAQERAPARTRIDETLGPQERQGLPDRLAAHAELASQGGLRGEARVIARAKIEQASPEGLRDADVARDRAR